MNLNKTYTQIFKQPVSVIAIYLCILIFAPFVGILYFGISTEGANRWLVITIMFGLIGLVTISSRTLSRVVLLMAIASGEWAVNISGKTPALSVTYLILPTTLFFIILRRRGLLLSWKQIKPTLLAWITYIILLIPSILISRDPANSILQFSEVILSFLLFLVVFELSSPSINDIRQASIFVTIIIVGIGLVYIIYSLNIYGIKIISDVFNRGLVSELPHIGRSNYLAGIFNLGLPILIAVALETKATVKLYAFFGIFILVVALLFTISRGGFIVSSLSIGLILIFAKKIKSQFLIILLISIVLIMIVLSNAGQVFIQSLTFRFTEFGDRDRFLLFETAWRLFRTNPIFGVGYGYRMSIPGAIFGNARMYTHNLLLGTAMESGLLGLFGTTLLYFSLLKNGLLNLVHFRSSNLLYAGILTAIIAGFLHNMIEPTFRGSVYRLLYWYLVALLAKSWTLRSIKYS